MSLGGRNKYRISLVEGNPWLKPSEQYYTFLPPSVQCWSLLQSTWDWFLPLLCRNGFISQAQRIERPSAYKLS